MAPVSSSTDAGSRRSPAKKAATISQKVQRHLRTTPTATIIRTTDSAVAKTSSNGWGSANGNCFKVCSKTSGANARSATRAAYAAAKNPRTLTWVRFSLGM